MSGFAPRRGPATPDGIRLPHAHGTTRLEPGARTWDRRAREALEESTLASGATLAHGAGARPVPEEPDPVRTCFERDRDRILHSSAFRRLAGKTQVFIFPADHQRTRLTHALEVAQVATAISRASGLNTTLAEAIALGHDCGHGPFGHASEDALTPFVPEGFDHAVWGADVTTAPLNLCAQTSDGIRNHSWSRPAPSTPEAEVCSLADRIAYCAHDLEDALNAGVVRAGELPEAVTELAGTDRASQLGTFIGSAVHCITTYGLVGLDTATAQALEALRAFNYERVYMRSISIAQSRAVIAVLGALVEFFAENPFHIPNDTLASEPDPLRRSVGYVAGMTDRFAFKAAVELLGWREDLLPSGIDSPYPKRGL